MKSIHKKKVQLALGSGGARGIAHLGVMDELLERGYEITGISGTSMGAVVGGIYAAGFHNVYKEWMLSINKTRVFNLMDFTLEKQGFLKGEKVFEELETILQKPRIEQFSIPFTAVAADLTHKTEVWFNSGDLFAALRASIAIPGVFTPVVQDEYVLVDGAVLNPIPINALTPNEDEFILAVNLYGLDSYKSGEKKSSVDEFKILDEIKSWLNIQSKSTKPAIPKAKKHQQSFQNMLYYSFQMTQDRLTELMMEKYPPDLRIDIPRGICGTFDFHRTKDLIAVGREACREALNHYEKEQWDYYHYSTKSNRPPKL